MDMLASDVAADIWQKIALQHHYFYRKNKRGLCTVSFLCGVQAAVLKVRCSQSLALAPR